MPLKLLAVLKDAKVKPVLLKYAVKNLNEENVNFVADTSTNETLYKRWVIKTSKKQVNLPDSIQKPLDALAAANKWSEMTALMKQAKANVTTMYDRDVMPRFEASAEYKALDPTATETAKTVTAVKQMLEDMTAGTTFFNTAIANVKTKGKPADKNEVNRMFESARLRHDKVHEAFTERVQKDKGFTAATQAALFAKKTAFSKLYADYRKLLA